MSGAPELDFIGVVGALASVVLPLFNIPLIAKLMKCKSSKEYSLVWCGGVWACIVLMTPQCLRSEDLAFRAFGVVNVLFFSIVAFLIFKYRNHPAPSKENC